MQELDVLLHQNVTVYDGVLLFREIHTAKGQAGSLELSELVEVLHAFEEWLEPRRKNKIEAIEIQESLSSIASVVLDVQSQLKQIMGGAYPENSKTVLMPQTLYQDILAHLADHESLSSRLTALRQKPVRHYFQNYIVQAETLAQKLEKMIHPLLIEGGDFLVNESPWKEMASLCIHLLRNMIDHGIELPEEREDSGKDPEGSCKIVFLQENGETVIEFHDDGRGIDPEKIGDILVRKGLKSRDEVLQMSQDELVHSIFLPGFSSADAVTEFSGRGVGLDAVHGMVLSIGGSISVHSSLGEGTKFSIILPVGN
jgi:chemotaxis protein histidine kinase CheA